MNWWNFHRNWHESRQTERWELADKPGSVVDSHSSGMCVATHLKRPTREPCGPHEVPLFGLAPGGVYPATGVTTGAVRSYRTISPLPVPKDLGGIFSVALSVGLRPPGVTWHPALWSPDFPPRRKTTKRLPGQLPLLFYSDRITWN